MGLIYEQKDELEKAFEYFKQYLARAPQGHDFDVVSQKVKDLEARIQAASGRTAVARKQEKREPKARPKEPQREEEKPDVSAKVDRGISAFNRGDNDACIKQMEEVLRIDPRNTSAQYFLSEAKKRKSESEKEQQINDRLRRAQNAYQRRDYQVCIKQAEEVLDLEPGNASALNLLNEAKKKVEETNKEQQIRDGLQRAQQAYQGGNYQECITRARNVLSLDPANAQAKQYLSLANEKISVSLINALVNKYVQAVNSGKLLDFYQKNCSSECYQNVKSEAELIINFFSNHQSSAKNVDVRFKGEDRAEVSFFNTISGTNTAGTKQDIIKGDYKWDLEKQGDNWKIIGISSLGDN